MGILHSDKSIRAGWTTAYYDGSGWTGKDTIQAREQGWHLNIGAFGMAVGEVGLFNKSPKGLKYLVNGSGATFNGLAVPAVSSRMTISTINDVPLRNPESFARLLERAMCGEELSFKALYLMVYNDSERYGEWAKTVEALKPQYIESNVI